MKRWLKENRGFVLLIVGMALMRTAVADWNPVPSGSMRPAIVEGDVVLVNRLAYDLKVPLTDVRLLALGEPKRGDVVTFTSPRDGVRLIKRIVGLPGDWVALHDGVLQVNGEAAMYDDAVWVDEPLNIADPQSTVPALRAREDVAGHQRVIQVLPTLMHSQGSMVGSRVPEGHYFMLGDSRDNSVDSRSYGFVPRERLIGRAHHVLVSFDTSAWQPRWARMGTALK